jgi:DNA polymerase
VVCLGATALRAVLGRPATVGSLRGRIVTRPGKPALLVTVHPSYVLRVPPEKRGAALRGLVADLRVGARFVAGA